MSKASKILIGLIGAALAGSMSAAADFTFKYGNSQPEQAARSQSMIYFKEQLEERSGGRIEVKNFFGAVMGNEKEMYDQVTTGILQATREAGAAENGIHVPATGISQGFRMYTNNKRPITMVEDLQGLLIREPQVPLFIATGEALGSEAIPMAFSEVYQAFQQGVIDGQHNPPANIWNYKIHEVQKYLSVTNHMTGPDPLLVNKEWYDSLPEDLQQLFDEVAVEALALSDELARQAETELLEKLSQEMEVNYLTEEAMDGFRAAVQPVYQQFIDAGDFSQEDVDNAKAAAKSCG